MKKCTKCKNSKPTIGFHKNKLKKDGLQDNCKECCKVRDQNHYVKCGNHKHVERNKKQQGINREFVQRYKKIFCKCVDCGIKDWRVLQFDHLNNKKYNLADLGASSVSLNLIKTEIRKCEIRCANCHQIKTHHNG
tara:strand:+ start:99 stop:503 length:405 start_codon:yes stop_codon:yes gene_type:complete